MIIDRDTVQTPWIFACAVLLSSALACFAADDKRSTKLAKLVELWDIPGMVKEYRRNCLEPFKATTPVQTFRQDPSYFQGISPTSPLWPKVEAAYWRYAVSSCNALSEEAVKDSHIRAWAGRLTEEELDALLRFFQTRPGRAYIDGQRGVTEELLRFYGEEAKTATKAAYEAYMKDLRAIATEFEQLQRKPLRRQDSTGGTNERVGHLSEPSNAFS
jgi:hypothetical protein